MFTDKCGPNGTDSWWQDAKFCQLACWEAGVGYEGRRHETHETLIVNAS